MTDLPKAIVWDLDGTLVDSAPDIGRALNVVLEEAGHDAIPETSVRTMIGDGVAKLVERGFRAVGRELDGPGIESMVKRFMALYTADPVGATRLYDGVAERLAEFAAAGVRQGVCTNKPEGVSRSILEKLGIEQYFGAVVGGDTTAAKKPDPTPLRVCMDKLGVGAEDAVMIGDSAVDAATARALNLPVGLYRHGYARTDVSSIDADFVVDDFASLPQLIAAQISSRRAMAC